MRPERDSRPGANRTAKELLNSDIQSLRPLSDYLLDFEVALLADAFRQASSAWWLKRAEDFEWAKPRLGEFYGARTPAELSAQWQHCDAVARACRAKAALIRLSLDAAELWDEVA